MVVGVERFFVWELARGGSVKKKSSFYLFLVLVAALFGVVIWGVSSSEEGVSSRSDDLTGTEGYIRTQSDTEKARAAQEPREYAEEDAVGSQSDETLFEASLAEGFTPTQDVGELGSLNGVIKTKDYPMNYKPTKYERLTDSPLLVFTDEMIWKTGEDEYVVKRDAMADQAYHYQESAIALSIAPHIEKGQLKGYQFVEIPDGTLFSKLGMKSGDVLLSINGKQPDMEPMALMFVNMVAGRQGRTSIVVEHRGNKRTINIRAAE